MRKKTAPISVLLVLMLLFQSYGYAGASPNGHAETDESQVVSSAAEEGATYYVDAELGSDANDGTNAAKPWATLDKVNAQRFKAGDRILFKAGSAWEGQLAPQGSGSPGKPIIIDKYGSEDANIRPIIHG
ncbi:hypothetical protein [Paenibacillus sp. 1001270B_150601_E10]|uniref:hypothetical protein n=1 Tax=Paenibacillus sp. 1001270B_150601_E10 TaxID=2787079 RepID=UPI0018A05B08|nr:hypothetical protein [Paenibacillus sp. 1001270B_150601_E10]